jgi:hypothetical protein
LMNCWNICVLTQFWLLRFIHLYLVAALTPVPVNALMAAKNCLDYCNTQWADLFCRLDGPKLLLQVGGWGQKCWVMGTEQQCCSDGGVQQAGSVA